MIADQVGIEPGTFSRMAFLRMNDAKPPNYHFTEGQWVLLAERESDRSSWWVLCSINSLQVARYDGEALVNYCEHKLLISLETLERRIADTPQAAVDGSIGCFEEAIRVNQRRIKPPSEFNEIDNIMKPIFEELATHLGAKIYPV